MSVVARAHGKHGWAQIQAGVELAKVRIQGGPVENANFGLAKYGRLVSKASFGLMQEGWPVSKARVGRVQVGWPTAM